MWIIIFLLLFLHFKYRDYFKQEISQKSENVFNLSIIIGFEEEEIKDDDLSQKDEDEEEKDENERD